MLIFLFNKYNFPKKFASILWLIILLSLVTVEPSSSIRIGNLLSFVIFLMFLIRSLTWGRDLMFLLNKIKPHGLSLVNNNFSLFVNLKPLMLMIIAFFFIYNLLLNFEHKLYTCVANMFVDNDKKDKKTLYVVWL